ncbi:cation:proton antiporter domain-containing protein [Cellulomonas alba]|uniref:Cation:proton antiporter n=1 Tax=Cellulomonas alba TaxID=3053467 RepID=A0ABT7SEH7_9CELL|nr:cation:proton antiporter [Cellulomonas alba]MDM7854585.1 cation:proton antiporter [Cellulomonas alba]
MLGFVGGLAFIVVAGVAGQVVGRSARVPSIIVLLLLGILVGPVTGWLDPDAVLGSRLYPLVSMAVGLLLFEESLKLDLTRLRGGARRPVLALVTVGALITALTATLAAHWLLGLPIGRAGVIGAILIVSGPTVVGPLLALIRPKQPLESVLAFEGIFIDPIGATAALAVTNMVLHGEPVRLGVTGLTGVGVGLVGAVVFVLVVRWRRIDPATHVAIALAVALAVYAVAEALHDEAGLFATTALGVAVANQTVVRIDAVHEFGSHIGLVLIGALFIVLAARVDLHALARYALPTLALVAVLVLVIRPLAAAAATARSVLDRNERAMVAAMAPRGIVAASTASVFALRFEDAGTPFPQLVPVVFGVVLATAVVYGVAGPLVARRLGVRTSEPVRLDDDGVPVVVTELAAALDGREPPPSSRPSPPGTRHP